MKVLCFARKLVGIVLSLLLFANYLPLALPIFAADSLLTSMPEFSTTYDVTYDIEGDGTTLVTEKVILKNLTSQYFATQFKLTIGATQISDIKASDSSGPLETKLEQKDTSTIITAKFNQQVVGVNKEFPWTLQFKSKDFAQKLGRVWEITVPRIAAGSNIAKYDVTLSVPQSFGDPTLINPTPLKSSTNFGRTFVTFNKDQLQNNGVSASFGQTQVFDFDLTYNLESTSLVPFLTNIALPPDTNYQDVIFTRIEPKPLQVSVDDDGNYLAWYRLNRNQKISVQVTGSAKIYSNPQIKNPSLPGSLRNKYLNPAKYWESDNQIIKTKLSEILGNDPSNNNLDKARLIHRWVANNLKYNPQRLTDSDIERLGAVTALTNPSSAVCMEFTDLFIALARAAGIPARELDGFAYTSNNKLRPSSLTKDILHAWPEIWDDKRGWIMIDPTWENTTGGVDYFDKLDLDHFVFAVKGISSESPSPAGSYKYLGKDSKNVKVTLSDSDFTWKPQLEMNYISSNPLIAGFPNKIKIRLINLGSSYQPPSDFSINSSSLIILDPQSKKLGPIPAFGYEELVFNTRTASFLDNFQDILNIKVGNQTFKKEVSVRPLVNSAFFSYLAGGFLGLLFLIYFVILGRFIYRRRFKKS